MWQNDYGQVDRALFLRDSRAYRARLAGRRILERAPWVAVFVAVVYVLGRML